MHRAATPKTKRRPPSAQDATHEVTTFKRTERTQRESNRTIRKARFNGSDCNGARCSCSAKLLASCGHG